MQKFPTDLYTNRTGTRCDDVSQRQLERAKALKIQHVTTDKEISKAAGGFEALLLQQIMKSMWEGMEFSGFMGEDSNQAEIIRGMFSQAVADEVASGRGIGVKEVVKSEIAKRNLASEKLSKKV